MKNLSSALRSHYASDVTTLATCWKATLANGPDPKNPYEGGTVVAATGLDRDIVFDGLTYKSAQSYMPSNIDSSSELNPDNLEIEGFLASPAITDDDIHSGLWDYAAIEIFEVNYNDLSMGINELRGGTLGEVRGGRSKFTAELRGLLQAYTRTIVRLVTKECPWDLGDDRCKIDLTAITVSGTVQSVVGNRIINDVARTEEAEWFTGGKLTMTSGANAGLSMEVKRSAPGQLELTHAFYEPIAPDDTYTVYAGCLKRFEEDCKTKHNNVPNFGGFPHLPGNRIYRQGGIDYGDVTASAIIGGTGGTGSGGTGTGGSSGGGGSIGGSTGTGSGTLTPVPTGVANGSTVTLARDTIYYGTLDVSGKTGVTVAAAAGTGKAPVVSPGKAITGWTVHSGSIYKANVDFVPAQLSLNDAPVKRASWPVNVPPWSTSPSSVPVADLIGATLYVLSNQSVINSSVMTGNTVSTSSPFYVEGKLWMITGANAWAYESGVLYVWTPDGLTPEGRAWAAPDQVGINADNSSGVTINGVDVVSASDGISGVDSTNLHIRNSRLLNLSKDGVYAGNSSGLVVDGGSITNASQNGVNAYYGSNSVTVKNCPMTNIGTVGNPCPSFAGIHIGGPNTGTLVQNNTITNVAYHGISVNQNRNSTISGNTIDGFCKRLLDGGGIYTQSVDRSALAMTISGNTVNNGTGSEVIGIYLDDGSNGVTVTGNTLTGNTIGTMLHNAFNNTITLNTFNSSVTQHILFNNSGAGSSTTYGNSITYNTLKMNGNEYAYNLDHGSSFSAWATWNHNTYTSTSPAKFARTWDGSSAGIDYSYTAWKSMIGQDANSTMNGA